MALQVFWRGGPYKFDFPYMIPVPERFAPRGVKVTLDYFFPQMWRLHFLDPARAPTSSSRVLLTRGEWLRLVTFLLDHYMAAWREARQSDLVMVLECAVRHVFTKFLCFLFREQQDWQGEGKDIDSLQWDMSSSLVHSLELPGKRVSPPGLRYGWSHMSHSCNYGDSLLFNIKQGGGDRSVRFNLLCDGSNYRAYDIVQHVLHAKPLVLKADLTVDLMPHYYSFGVEAPISALVRYMLGRLLLNIFKNPTSPYYKDYLPVELVEQIFRYMLADMYKN